MVADAFVGILIALGFLALTSCGRSSRTSAGRLRSLVIAAQPAAGFGASETGSASAESSIRVAIGIGLLIGAAVGAGGGRALGPVNGIVAGLAFGCLAAFVVLRVYARRVGRPCATPGAVRTVPVRTVGGRTVPVRTAAAVPSPATLPAALDLLAACLSAGAPLEQALSVVAAAFASNSVGRLLGGIARLTALGAPPELAWADALADPAFGVVARSVIRAHYSGASLSDVLSRASDERRRTLRSDAEVAAARASVRAVLPLGLCFLPAFVLVGVVPVVAGFAGSMWS